MNKALISFILIFYFFLYSANPSWAISPPQRNKVILKGTIYKTLVKGKKIDVLPETTINSELNLEGDYFSAYLSEKDALKLQVPLGSKLSGFISHIKQKRYAGRDAVIGIHANKLILPDGQTIKLDAQFNTSNAKPVKHISKKVARDVGVMGASALVGAKDALRYGGISTAISTYGISIGVGAGIGLGFGMLGVLQEKGNIRAGDRFSLTTLELESDLNFLEEPPLMAQLLRPFSAKYSGIDLSINRISKHYSQTFGNFLLLDLNLANHSKNKIHVSDFVLSSKKNFQPLFNNALILGKEGFKSVNKDKQDSIKLAFSLSDFNKKDGYKLQLIDPKSSQILVDFDINLSQYL